MEKIKLSVVVPAYNEEKCILSVINRLKKILVSYSEKTEIIVINDYSKDRTAHILSEIKGIQVVNNNRNLGYGASLKRGISIAEGEWILITDADGTYPIEAIPRLLEYTKEYDMVVGARRGKNVHIPLLRKPAKWFLNKVGNYVASMNIPDLNSGLRIFKKELAREFWRLFPERFSFTITLTLAALTNGYAVKYIPIDYHKRKGKSTIHPIKDFIGFNKLLLKMMLFFRPLKIFIPLSVLVFIVGLGIFLTGLLVYNKFFDVTFAVTSLSAVQIFMLGLIAELIIRNRDFK